MTDAEKKTIIHLKKQGAKFTEIASLMGIPLTTVKSFCYRHKTAFDLPDICPQCGKPIVQSKYKPKRFCSDACRILYWKEHTADIHRKTAIPVKCPVCGKVFSDYPQRKRKYCSHACYIADRYYGGQKK